MATKFKKLPGRSRGTKDESGKVRVAIMRVGEGSEGNITGSISIEVAKVSEVIKLIETALFG